MIIFGLVTDTHYLNLYTGRTNRIGVFQLKLVQMRYRICEHIIASVQLLGSVADVKLNDFRARFGEHHILKPVPPTNDR